MKKLHFKENTELTLQIIKEKDDYKGNLLLNDYLINTFNADEFIDLDISNFEGKELTVKIVNDSILLDGTKILQPLNIFKKGNVVNLTVLRNKPVIYIDKQILAELSFNDLPNELFVRRKLFKVKINSDDNWEVIRYANLHQHTYYSLLDGFVSPQELAKKSEYACAITDHGNMFGALEFYKEMKKQNKKPIIGFEAYIETLNGPMLRLKNKKGENVLQEMFDINENQNIETTNNLEGQHLILLAKNEVGLKNLFKLTTEAELHKYKKPHVTYEMLEKYHDGLIATSACIAGTLSQTIKNMLDCIDESSIVSALKEKFGDDFYAKKDLSNVNDEDMKIIHVYKSNHLLAKNYIEKMVSIFGKDDFYIEIQDHHFDFESRIMNEVKNYAKKYDIKITVGIDAHYLNKEDKTVHEMWLAGQTKTTMEDEKRMKFSGDGYYVHSSKEVVELFKDIPEALDNTLEIADKCEIKEFSPKGYHLPHYPLPEGYDSEFKYLQHECVEGFKRNFKNTPHYEDKVYRDRLNYELTVIKKMGWPAYFLIVSDFIKYAEDDKIAEHIDYYFPKNNFNQKNIPSNIIKDYKIYSGAGSSSRVRRLVAYCLGITKVDPIKYDLLFERFLNPDRISMPDIDTDIEDAGREQVLDYVRYKYGAKNTAKIITFNTYAARAAIKGVARILNKPLALATKIANLIPKTPGITIDEALQGNSDYEALLVESPDAKEIVKYAKMFEGKPVNKGIHACGNLITDKAVVNYMPQVLMTGDNGEEYWTTQFVGPECEDMGCLKMDFLGLRTLGVAHECTDLIKKDTGKEIVYDEIPLDDAKVYAWLAKGNTEAVFQMESQYTTDSLIKVYKDIPEKITTASDEQLKKIGEECFLRMSDLNALVRPGPQAYINQYAQNINEPENITYQHELMKDTLSSTYGIMLYQEQLMKLVKIMAGFSAGQADKIRKACGKKIRSILDEYKNYFVYGSIEKNIKGCVKNGVPEKTAMQIWDDMEKFGSYGFNKSHSIAYSLHSARTAWLAYYYPTQYMCACLNSYVGGSDAINKIKKLINACKKKEIKILEPSVNMSQEKFSTEGNDIRFGLSGLKSVGKISENIIAERNAHGKFTSYENFLYRLAMNADINKRALEALIYVGALDEFPGTRKDKINALENACEYISEMKQIAKINTVFDILKSTCKQSPTDYLHFELTPSKEEFEEELILKKENEFAGFYISGHPLDKYLPKIKKHKSFDEIIEGKISGYAKIVGVLSDVNEKISKKGTKFYTFIISDKTDSMEGILFVKDGEIPPVTIFDDNVVEIEGKIESSDYGLKINARQVNNIADIIPFKYNSLKIKLEDEDKINEFKEIYQSLEKGNTKIIATDSKNKALLGFEKNKLINLAVERLLKDNFGSKNVTLI